MKEIRIWIDERGYHIECNELHEHEVIGLLEMFKLRIEQKTKETPSEITTP